MKVVSILEARNNSFGTRPRCLGGTRLIYDRLQAMDIGDTLTPQERELLVEMLYNREPALAFDMSEIGLFSSDIEPLHVISTVALHSRCRLKYFPASSGYVDCIPPSIDFPSTLVGRSGIIVISGPGGGPHNLGF